MTSDQWSSSSTTGGPDTWFGVRLLNRWSIVFFGIAFTVGVLGHTIVTPIGDPDIWWVAAAGRDMLATLRAPTTNAYSFTAPAFPWVMHEWVLGPIFASGLRTWGPAFFAVAAVVMLAATVPLVLGRTSDRALLPITCLLVTVLCLVFFGRRFLTVRPTGISLFFLVAMISLAFGRTFDAKRAILAVVLQLVWVNAHGSFPLGIFLLFGSALAGDRSLAKARVASALAASAVTFINPYGAKLHLLVWQYFTGAHGAFSFIHSNIDEFAPIWNARGVIALPHYVAVALLVALSISGLFFAAYRVRAIICLIFAWLAAVHVRHVEQFGLVACLLLAPVADHWLRRLGFRRPEMRFSIPNWALVLPGCLVALALIATQPATQAQWIAKNLGGPAFVELASRIPNDARVYAPFQPSGLLIWLEAQRNVRVFYDPRNDCYPADVAHAALTLELPRTKPETVVQILERYGTDHVLVSASHPVARALRQSSAFRVSAREKNWTLFASSKLPGQ